MSEKQPENTPSTTPTSEPKQEVRYVDMRLAEIKEEGTGVPRKPVVRFQPGVSANPAGRPKGLKNKITLLKADLELDLRQFSKKYVPHVLAKAIEMALNGDRAMIKAILDLHMSKVQHQEESESNKGAVQILVQNLTQGPVSTNLTTSGGESAVEVKALPHSPVSIEATVLSGDENGKSASSGSDGNSKEHSVDDSSGSKAGS